MGAHCSCADEVKTESEDIAVYEYAAVVPQIDEIELRDVGSPTSMCISARQVSPDLSPPLKSSTVRTLSHASTSSPGLELPRLLKSGHREIGSSSVTEPIKSADAHISERLWVVIERDSAEDFLGMDVKPIDGDLLEVVRICPDGVAAKTTTKLMVHDIVRRINGVGTCAGMAKECTLRADLRFEIIRVHTGETFHGNFSASDSNSKTFCQKRGAPQVPKLKLPLKGRCDDENN